MLEKLQLTESKLFPGHSHRDMLLEMCNNLIGPCSWSEDGESIIFESVKIPWMEVCVAHLPKFLSTGVNWSHSIAVSLALNIQDFYYRSRHVVDALYQIYRDNTAWKKTK